MQIESQSIQLYNELKQAIQSAQKGHLTLSKNIDDWTILCDAVWTKRRLKLKLSFSVPGTEANFPHFRTGRSGFFGAFMRQNSLLSQSGAESEMSKLMLSNRDALRMLEEFQINRLEWKDNSLTVFSNVKKKREDLIMGIFVLFGRFSTTVRNDTLSGFRFRDFGAERHVFILFNHEGDDNKALINLGLAEYHMNFPVDKFMDKIFIHSGYKKFVEWADHWGLTISKPQPGVRPEHSV